MSNCPPNLGFLIDENLSPEMVNVITTRGFRAHAVARDRKLRGRGDTVIARYAIEHDLILVTNNAVDFERIYAHKEYHPGIILICTENAKLRKKDVQLKLIELAIDEIEKDCLCQEVVQITARKVGRYMDVEVARFYLPDLDAASVAA